VGNAHTNILGEYEYIRLLGKAKRGLKDNIKTDKK
jgi:hypothetical protein